MPKNILLVDDEQNFLEAVSAILKEKRFNVFTARHGIEALGVLKDLHLKQKKIDVVLTDSHMPSLNGFELIKKIYRFDRTLPIIMASGFATKASKNKAKVSGVRFFLEKPFSHKTVISAINKALKESGKQKVLVVDDHKNLVNGLSKVLKADKRLFVVNTTKGIQAVEKVKERDFDLIYVDINLPDLHGLDVIKKIIEIRPHAFVVIITGESTKEEIQKGLELGAKTYMEKPIALEYFLDKTKKFLAESKSWRDNYYNIKDENSEDKPRGYLDIIIELIIKLKNDLFKIPRFKKALIFFIAIAAITLIKFSI